jgi:single-stranded-DNA-specific exonuclease
MVYKFCQYIDKFLGKNYADELLDLVAVGMVADMMDLRNFETKELVSLGMNKLRNPFIINFVDA